MLIPEVGQTFTVRGSTYRRETDDPSPMFECERMRVTHLTHPECDPKKWRPYTFGAEAEWFRQRRGRVS